MSKYTNEEIMANRRKWIDFLKSPFTKKATGKLEGYDSKRCCLGHGCYVLGIPSKWHYDEERFYYDDEAEIAPESFIDMVGLWNHVGAVNTTIAAPLLLETAFGDLTSLAALNDLTQATPQQIGAYLESVIEGGPGTPFRKLH